MQLPPRGGKDEYADFTLNTISKKAVAYSCGTLALAGAEVKHNHDPDELKLCRRLADQAARQMKGIEVGMGSEGSAYFSPFFIAANVGDRVPARLTGRLIHKAFGGTIYPPAKVWVEPLRERGEWWKWVLHACSSDEEAEEEECLQPWRKMMKWFNENELLHGTCFVMIGDDPLDKKFENAGCVFPRLALGITAAGSLVGICSHVVHT
jgi:hypothetical protein